MNRRGISCAVVLSGLLSSAVVSADVFNMAGGQTSLQFVPVGNPGNAADSRVMSDSTSGYGAVGYTYNIGKFEVTAGQYAQFLNAVAATDTYGLYSPSMDNSAGYGYGCNIQQTGSSGSYTYSVASDWANRPVNYVSWGDAARFVNWLTNGQPTYVQNSNATETGAYSLNGTTDSAALAGVTRSANARYVLPTENEWYKAAYHKNAGTAGTYWAYATRSNSAPGNVLSSPDTGNSANCSTDSGFTLGASYWTSPAGAFANSASSYGALDMGGNVAEMTETVTSDAYRVLRGGSFVDDSSYILADARYDNYVTDEFGSIGFRIAEVPEPASMGLLGAGAVSLLLMRRNKKIS